jgi:hypothetical protein
VSTDYAAFLRGRQALDNFDVVFSLTATVSFAIR